MMLMNKPLCVCEITDILELSISTVSNHLSILKEAGFLSDEKYGKWVIYSLNKSNSEPKIQQALLMLPMWLGNDALVCNDREQVKSSDRKTLCGI